MENNKNDNKLLPCIKNNLPPVTPPVYKRYSKEELQQIIEQNYGIVTILCGVLDCTYSQFYKAIDYFKLRDCLAESKSRLVSLAEKAVLECLTSQNEQIKLKAAETTLKSLGKNDGWGVEGTTINQQINVVDKTAEIKNIFGIS